MTLDNVVFRCSVSILLLLCLCASGCNNNVKVSGTVTYSDTNEPVKFGTVIFNGEKEVGRGAIKDGKYSIGLINDGDGVPPGKYTISADSPYIPEPPKITVIGMDGQSMQMNPQTQERELYYTEEPQTVEITKSMTYDFQVERGVRPRR